jgi:hypothetical protein
MVVIGGTWTFKEIALHRAIPSSSACQAVDGEGEDVLEQKLKQLEQEQQRRSNRKK